MERRWWEFWKRPDQVELRARRASEAPADVPASKPRLGQEVGASGTEIWSGVVKPDEYNLELVGQDGLLKLDEMRRSNAQVKATLEIVKLPLRSATWDILPAEKGDTTDEGIADSVHQWLLGQNAMADPFDAVLRHSMLQFDFGCSGFEKVWTVGDAGEFRYKRLAPRLPKTFKQFYTNPDGTLNKVVQRAFKNGRQQDLPIDGEYFVPLVHEREGDNYFGLSMLRSAFLHWFYVSEFYRIAGVKHHRWGVGIPIAKLMEGQKYSTNDLAATRRTLDSFVAAHDAKAIEPANMTYRIMTPDGSGAGGSTGLLEDITHHTSMIGRVILAGFLADAAEGLNSGRTKTLADIYLDALSAKERDISTPFQTHVIKPLCDLNFDMRGRTYPRLGTTDLSKLDVTDLATVAKDLSMSRILTPDDDVENVFRALLMLPPLSDKMKRANRPAPVAPTPADQNPDEPPVDSNNGDATTLRLRGTVGRQPTRLEMLILSLVDIPRRLDTEIDALVNRLTEIRRRQLRWAAAKLARLDARPTQPFTDIRPGALKLPYQAEMTRAIRETQDNLIQFGAEQVRLELRRQGAPITIFASETVALAQNTPGEAKRTVRSHAVTTAKITSKRLTDTWESSILDAATRDRRVGTQGADLEAAIIQELDDAAESGVGREVNARAQEAFSAGRALEANQQSDHIEMVVQSAVLDRNTCMPCEKVDGTEMAFGSDLQQALEPPYVECEGRNQCRCVQLFIYSGAR